jgi:epoxyqueuosine reductase
MFDVDNKLSTEILKIAHELGADLAGFVAIKSLKDSPSHKMYSKVPVYTLSENMNPKDDQTTQGKVVWPKKAETILIIAIKHPEDTPSLDYWCNPYSGGTEGNAQLIRTNHKILAWLEENKGIKGEDLSYFVEDGGICLKDAAVLAGLGVIGKNNMFVSPQFGPRVRLRAMALPVKLHSTGPTGFDPCASCEMYCRKACPQGAFDEKVFSSNDYGHEELPAREGVYARATCKIEMKKNTDEAELVPIDGKDESMRVMVCCRACEFACPVGNKN